MANPLSWAMMHADLSLYTQEEIALAKEMHDESCYKGCTDAFASLFDPYGWLDMAREELNDRPQKEVLF